MLNKMLKTCEKLLIETIKLRKLKLKLVVNFVMIKLIKFYNDARVNHQPVAKTQSLKITDTNVTKLRKSLQRHMIC